MRHRRADHPRGVARLDARVDDLLQQRFLDAAAAVVFHQRLVRAARRRNPMAVHRGQQVQQLPVVVRPPDRASRPTRRRGRARRPAAAAVAESFHNCATVVRKFSRLTIRSPSPTNSKSVALLAVFEHLAVDAVVGAVAVGHVLVGRAEKVVFVVRFRRLFRLSVVAENARRPSRSGALANTPRHWLRGNRGTSAPAASVVRAAPRTFGGGRHSGLPWAD